MSGWGMGWFGGGTVKRKDAPKNAILGLRSNLEMLNKREKHLQLQIDEQDALARKYVATNKNAAKAALRRKKQLQTTLEQTEASMVTLEREIGGIETANINKETMESMRAAGQALKQIHAGLTVDTVEKQMCVPWLTWLTCRDDLREQHEITEEITNALTTGAITAGQLDDDELEEELENLQQEQLDEKMLGTGPIPQDKVQRMPAAATGELPTKKTQEEEDEEEELRSLQAAMMPS